MRVLIVPKWYPWPDRPVFGIFCREQARSVLGVHDVVVLASEAVRRPPFAVFSLGDSVEEGLRTLRIRYRRPRLRPLAMACQVVGMLVALRRLRRGGWRPDVVHAHVYSAALPALILAWISRAPLVISEHFTGFQRGLITGYDRFTARVAFRYAALVAPVSQDLARRVAVVQPRARVRVVDNVVDTDVFYPPATRGGHDPGVLLNVAALTAKKGQADLLTALTILPPRRRLMLHLVGDGELRSALQARAGELGLAESVQFHGECSKAEVAELMRQADLFVLPSRFENLPVALLEAMASGLPAVASAVGGIPDLTDIAGAALYLCPPGRPDELAAAIGQALDAAVQIDGARLAARTAQRFGYAASERTWTQIYEELVERRRV